MRFAQLILASLFALSLNGCHGVAIAGPCSYNALVARMDRIDESHDKAASKADQLGRVADSATMCALDRYGANFKEYSVIRARADLRSGLQFQKARDFEDASSELGAAASEAEHFASDSGVDWQARADARHIARQARDALSALPTR